MPSHARLLRSYPRSLKLTSLQQTQRLVQTFGLILSPQLLGIEIRVPLPELQHALSREELPEPHQKLSLALKLPQR